MNGTNERRYGRTEMKLLRSRHLAMAVGVSIAIHAAAIGAYLLMTGEAVATTEDAVYARDTIVVLPPISIEPPSTLSATTPKHAPGTPREVTPPRVMRPSTAEFAMGNLHAAPDDRIDSTAPQIATVDVMATSMPVASGTGTLGGGVGTVDGGDRYASGGLAAADGSSQPMELWSIPHEQWPKYDQAALATRVRYPAMERRNGIEARVVLQVLIGTRGSVEDIRVKQHAARPFEEAAISAVRATTFTPAIVGTTPVRVWMSIPVDFRLN